MTRRARRHLIALLPLALLVPPSESRAQGEGATGTGYTPLESYERWPAEAVEAFRSIPVQEEGRLKPIETVARYKLLRMNGAKRLKLEVGGEELKLSASEWLMDCLFRPEVARRLPVFKVNNPDVMVNIGLEPHASPRQRYAYDEINAPGVMRRLSELTAGYSAILGDEDREDEGKALRRDPVKAGVMALKSQINEFDWIVNALNFARDGLAVDLGEASGKFEKTGTGRTPMSVFLREFDAVLAEARGEGGEEFIKKLGVAFSLLERDTATAGVKDKTSITSLAMFPPVERGDEEWVKPGYLIERLSLRANELSQAEKAEFSAWAMPKIVRLESLAAAAAAGDDAAFSEEMAALNGEIVAAAKARGEYKTVSLELFWHRAGFFHWALGLYFIAFVLLAFTWLAPSSAFARIASTGVWLMTSLATLALVVGITVRCILLSRPPIATLYETILFITATAVILCMLIERVDRKRVALAVAVVLGLGGMFMAMRFEIKEGRDTLKVLEAVLRSNFWLATHVICINIGYMAALVAGAIGHVYIFARLFGVKNRDFLRSVTRMVYGVTCFGLLFALVGTVLGGVWANDSWGRFWGWDPKENGALMICLGGLILLHARMGGYIRDLGISMCAVLIGIITIFSWWHVNQLETGLHSYGFTSGIMFWILLSYGIEGAVLALGGLVFLREKLAATAPSQEPRAKGGAPPVDGGGEPSHT